MQYVRWWMLCGKKADQRTRGCFHFFHSWNSFSSSWEYWGYWKMRLWKMPLLFISYYLSLKYSSFTMLCYFLLYSIIIPLYICIHSFSLWFITGYWGQTFSFKNHAPWKNFELLGCAIKVQASKCPTGIKSDIADESTLQLLGNSVTITHRCRHKEIENKKTTVSSLFSEAFSP